MSRGMVLNASPTLSYSTSSRSLFCPAVPMELQNEASEGVARPGGLRMGRNHEGRLEFQNQPSEYQHARWRQRVPCE